MSWDATLHDDRGHCGGDWNYTHNTSPMIYEVLSRMGKSRLPAAAKQVGTDARWYERLSGLDGKAGAEYLASIIVGLEADPDHFREMNPPNGWGDYDDLIRVLREMRDAVPDWPTTWSASG